MEKEINELVNIGIELARSLKPSQEESEEPSSIVYVDNGNAEKLVAITRFIEVIFELDQKRLSQSLVSRATKEKSSSGVDAKQTGKTVFDDINVKFNISNLDELKKLINQAQYQVDQFEETLDKIKKFKIRVS